MNEKPWMLPKGQTIWYEGQAIDPYQEIAALRSQLAAARAVIAQFVYPGSPHTPEQNAALAAWQAARETGAGE